MEHPVGALLAKQFHQACTEFDPKDKLKIKTLASTLATLTKSLGQTETARIPRVEAGQHQSLWPDLRKLWRDVARLQLSFWDNEDSEEEEEETTEASSQKDNVLRTLCFNLATFTRNLVAGVPHNQKQAFENEPDIRRLLHFYTSWSAMEDPESIATARVLTQALSNTVTANDTLVSTLWDTYVNLPEDQVVIIRLLGSPDARTLLTTLVFILNCIHGSRARLQKLVTTKVGNRIGISLLDSMVNLHEAEEGTEAAKAFDLGYAIFTQIIEASSAPDLYRRFNVPNEIITPHQTTLLKLIDSYLQSNPIETAGNRLPDIMKIHESFGTFLAKRFFTLSAYAQDSVRASLGMGPSSRSGHHNDDTNRNSSESVSSPSVNSPNSSDSSSFLSPPAELDVMLPKVCEALVLVTQCIVTIGLEAEEMQIRVNNGITKLGLFINLKTYFIQKQYHDQGMVESLIGELFLYGDGCFLKSAVHFVELLRLLNLFLPRINFGKPIGPDGKPLQSPPPYSQKTSNGSGFSYLKRDLVRLLGVLSHGVKSVQDRTRDVGGIPVIMNMCVVDERNPYLREHAIFTLHNLLKNNSENQQVVNSFQPSQEWAEDGTLRRKLGAVLK
ncbi:spinocerebellar ataxia type 10 protein domain-containing protein [Panaeolus papilionaceus]|nr:spinocerebellar ataxia type 10 protein domain-containing protein [Panaeolus papilionaceus]